MSKQSDIAFENFLGKLDGPLNDIHSLRKSWNAALEWSRPLVADAIKKAKGEKKRFEPPSPIDVGNYMDEQGFKDPYATGQAFVDYYEARGWIPSGQRTQMKSWQAAVRTWKHHGAPLKPSNGGWQPPYGCPEPPAENGKKLIDHDSKLCLAVSKGGRWVQP